MLNHGTGAIKDTPNAKDFQWSEIAFGATPFNWNVGFDVEEKIGFATNKPNFKFPVKDQGGSGSCGGQAWSYYDAAIEAIASGTFEERSARFIYSQTVVYPAGSRGRDNSELLKSQGDAQETILTSYENGNPPTEAFMQKQSDITTAVKADAKKSRALSYANVDVNIDTIAQAIRDNNGVVLGVVGQNNGTWYTQMPVPPNMNNERWYHWVYAGKAKIINGIKYIGFLNSWGTSVGDHGWQYLSEDYINTILIGDGYGRAVWQVWTLIFNPDGLPTNFHYTFNNDLQYGQTSPEVEKLQTALQLNGVFPVAIKPTQYYGDITRTAVEKFQVKYGIAAWYTAGYGRTGPKTRAKLNELYS